MARKFGEDAVLLFRRVMRRCEAERLEATELSNGARMGAYACAVAGEGDVTMAVFLGADYRVKGRHILRKGGSGEPDRLSGEIIALCRRHGAPLVMFCASHRIVPEEILSFNLLYRALREAEITMVDLFEVCGDSYYSVLSDFGSCVYPSAEEDT